MCNSRGLWASPSSPAAVCLAKVESLGDEHKVHLATAQVPGLDTQHLSNPCWLLLPGALRSLPCPFSFSPATSRWRVQYQGHGVGFLCLKDPSPRVHWRCCEKWPLRIRVCAESNICKPVCWVRRSLPAMVAGVWLSHAPGVLLVTCSDQKGIFCPS